MAAFLRILSIDLQMPYFMLSGLIDMNKISQFWSSWFIEIVVLIIGLSLVHLIFLFECFRQTYTPAPEEAGQFGDFVGGYIGTIFTLVSILLLIRTLRHQQKSMEVQSFETKFFELIRIHSDNVAELSLKDSKGRKVFVWLLREFRVIAREVRKIAADHRQNLTDRQILQISYYCLFYGTGPNSSRLLKKSLAGFDPNFIEAVEEHLGKEGTKNAAMRERRFRYIPFEGHQSRLGHYYRHLFQSVSFVDSRKVDIDKYDYVKTLRAQLSTHEQALLLVNSLCPVGNDWWTGGYMKKYRMVKNIPYDFFAEDELRVEELFEDGYFEWQGIANEGS